MAGIKQVRKGRWKYDFRDDEGVRHVKQTFRTREEADRALRDCLDKLDRGTYVSPSTLPTFGELAEEWFLSKKSHHPASRAQWRGHLDLHLLPRIGKRRLDEIDVSLVEHRVRDAMVAAGLISRSANKILTTGSAIYKLAQRRDLVERNPFAQAERLREGGGELQEDEDRAHDDGRVRPEEVPTTEELRRLLDAAEPGFYRTLLLTAALTGARPGELRALQWSHVDFEAATLKIRRAHTFAHVRGEERRPEGRVYGPKTKAGVRDIQMEPALVAALKRWKLQCPPTNGALIFPGPTGSPFRESMVLRQGLYPALKRAELPHFNLKSLRHHFASFLILKTEGKDVAGVAHILGHADSSVTLRRYAHWFRRPKHEGMTELARAVCGEE